MKLQLVVLGVLVGGLAMPGLAQWDPPGGQWGKSHAADLRIMTWNIKDHICSTASKVEGYNSWCALARIVAAMKPDFLLLQETGDNEGNGTGQGVDSVSTLETTIGLFLHGGQDPFNGGQVTAWVQKYAPQFDLPYVYVSPKTDNYNRNALLSRYPFADLNGDGKSRIGDIPMVIADEYAPGGNGGIRGFLFGEIDLADGVYCGDLVIGNAHLKAGTDADSKQQRLVASQNTAYVIDYWFNGAGTGIPDPHDSIYDNPPATRILDQYTPVVVGGDWNEDELTNGRRGPADWLTQAAVTGGTDGTDRDRSDMTYDSAVECFTGQRGTIGPTTKFDYLAWQDSIAALRRAFIFYTLEMPQNALPPELLDFAYPNYASVIASDHRPVVLDLVMPLVAEGDCDPCADYVLGDTSGDGVVDGFDIGPFVALLTGG